MSASGVPGGYYYDAPQPPQNTFAQNALLERLRTQNQYGLEAMSQAGQTQRANIAADAAKYSTNVRQGNVSTYSPWAMGNYATIAAHQVPTSPEISVGPVWNPQQIQQQVNAGRAKNDQGTAAQGMATEEALAGKGYGANSPLLVALQGQQRMSNLGQNADLERQTRMGAQQANVDQILKSQQARATEFLGAEDIKAKRDQALLQANSAILAAILG